MKKYRYGLFTLTPTGDGSWYKVEHPLFLTVKVTNLEASFQYMYQKVFELTGVKKTISKEDLDLI